jgi:putative hydroxymethylpyrimidine transporter CytX
VSDRLDQALREEASPWDVRPVPADRRRLSGFDLSVLWGDLAIGVLVLLTGTLLVPALGLPSALLAIAVGTVVGCAPLAVVAFAGARDGVPGMVLFRPILGRRGSYAPSVLNILQLVGWTGFELWVMSLIASQMSDRLFGFSGYWLWLAVLAVLCTVLALGGPIVVVRRWLERFGAWVVVAVAAWISVRLLANVDLAEAWARPGQGGLPFWLAVDLVIAMPVSWLPLVGDYARFAHRPRTAAAGTFAGYAVGNAWLYALGALLALSAALPDSSPAGVGQAVASVAGGWVVLLALLVGETDEAFADVYSAAVSSQNLGSRLGRVPTILAVSAAGVGLAVWLGLRPGDALGLFESFLFLLGSVFVPLFGVFVGHELIVRRRPPPAVAGVRWTAATAWAAGFVVYQWCVPTGPAWWQRAVQTVLHGWLHLPFPLAGSSLGASIPAFVSALAVYVGASLLAGRPWRPVSGDARSRRGGP